MKVRVSEISELDENDTCYLHDFIKLSKFYVNFLESRIKIQDLEFHSRDFQFYSRDFKFNSRGLKFNSRGLEFNFPRS